MKLMTLIFSLSLLWSCGGGGGGGGESTAGGSDTMTVNVVSLTTATITATYTGDFTTTPQLFGMVSTNQTVVQMDNPTLLVSLCSGTITKSYPVSVCSNGGSAVNYVLISGSTSTIYSGTTGTVTLTSVGATGQAITGSFDAIVSHITDTKRVWGAFSVTNVF